MGSQLLGHRIWCVVFHFRPITTRTEIITNEDLEMLFRFCFRDGKANIFLQIFFRICFCNDHVGYVQATTAGHAYDIN